MVAMLGMGTLAMLGMLTADMGMPRAAPLRALHH